MAKVTGCHLPDHITKGDGILPPLLALSGSGKAQWQELRIGTTRAEGGPQSTSSQGTKCVGLQADLSPVELSDETYSPSWHLSL